VVAHAEVELAEDPCGYEKKREGLLRLIVEQSPADEGGQRPEKHGRGPVLLNVEDLADEGDGRAGGDGSDCVERCGEAEEPGPREAASDVKDGDHGADERETRGGAELVPVGGDEKHDTAGEENRAEDERGDALPFEAGTVFGGRLRLMRADAGSGGRVEDAVGLPTRQKRFNVGHGDWLKS